LHEKHLSTLSSATTRQLPSCDTSCYRNSRNKNRVRSEQILPVVQPNIFTPVPEIANSQHTYAEARVVPTASAYSPVSLQTTSANEPCAAHTDYRQTNIKQQPVTALTHHPMAHFIAIFSAFFLSFSASCKQLLQSITDFLVCVSVMYPACLSLRQSHPVTMFDVHVLRLPHT
jgi:hypothetical protein